MREKIRGLWKVLFGRTTIFVFLILLQLILNKEYGFMVAYKNREIVKVPLSEIAGKLKYVSPDASIIKEAKMLGVCFGD